LNPTSTKSKEELKKQRNGTEKTHRKEWARSKVPLRARKRGHRRKCKVRAKERKHKTNETKNEEKLKENRCYFGNSN
jgi:hypothetical protein